MFAFCIKSRIARDFAQIFVRKQAEDVTIIVIIMQIECFMGSNFVIWLDCLHSASAVRGGLAG